MRRAIPLLAAALACSSSQEPAPPSDPLATPGGLLATIAPQLCAGAALCGTDVPRVAGCGYAVEAPDCSAYARELAASASAACAAHTVQYHHSIAEMCESAASLEVRTPATKKPDPGAAQCVAAADAAGACPGASLAVASPSTGAAYELPLACTCAILAVGDLPPACADLLGGRALDADLCAAGGAGGSGGAGGGGGLGGGGAGGGGSGGGGSGGGGAGGSAGAGGHGGG